MTAHVTRVLSVAIDGFRNLRSVRFEPSAHGNVFVGGNGAGKTSLLEAIDYVATLRSFRGAQRDAMVSHAHDAAELSVSVSDEAVAREFRVRLTRKGRESTLDGKRPTRAIAWYGGASCVVFQPQDLELVRGPPELRRRYLDRMLVRCVDGYGEALRAYARALKSRNAVLRDERPDEASLIAYDTVLARAGAYVVTHRSRLAGDVLAFARAAANDIGLSEEVTTLTYATRAPADADAFLEALRRARSQDLARRTTTLGPHTDDLKLTFGEHAARDVASQGQTRAIALAMRIAEAQLLRERSGRVPFLLLDDVSSELDRARTKRLFEVVRALDAQVWVTTTDAGVARLVPGARVWRVEAGEVHAGGAQDGTSTGADNRS